METMTVEELRAYLEALQSAVYVPGQGFRVQTPDGQTVVLSPEQVKQTTDQVNARIGELTTNVFEAVGGAIGGAAERAAANLAAPGKTAAQLRAEQVAAGQAKLSKVNQKLVDDLLEARRKVVDTANQVAGFAPSQGEKTQADVVRWEKRAADAEAALAKKGLRLDDQNRVVRIGQQPAAPSVSAPPPPGVATGRTAAGGTGATTQPVVGGPPSPMSISAIDRAGQSVTQPVVEAPTVVTPRAAAPAVDRAAQATYVSSQLANRGLPDTPKNRQMLRNEFRRTGGVSEQKWMAEFRAQYPAYAEWTTDAVIQHFGQDFIDLIKNVASGEVEYTDESFRAALRNTAYGMRTTEQQINFDALGKADQQNAIRIYADQIRKDYGDVEFSESQIAELARIAARSGLAGTGLRQEVYRSAFRMAEGQQVPGLRVQALRGEDADRINRVARAYGRKATDAEIRSILTGEPLNGVVLTEEGLTQRLQAEAKALFPQFADQIDAGVTLETIGDRYKKYAADLLEMPEDNIDMFSGPYLKAFGDREKGPLSLYEWQQTVKSDPTFGWQYTKQANDQATSIGLSLARAFGAVQ